MEQEKILEKDTVVAGFEIRGCFWKENCLPDLNNLLGEATRHPFAYRDMKSDLERVVINAIRRGLKGWQARYRVRLDITWGEKAKGNLRDWDNVVAAGRKIINDALTKSQTIQDDSPRFMGYGNNEFVYTDKPFIKVDIVRIEDFKR